MLTVHRCRRRAGYALLAGIAATTAAVASPAAATRAPTHAQQSAALDARNLSLAAAAIEAQALSTGALKAPVDAERPAAVILQSDVALIDAAIRAHHTRHPTDTTAVMGSVPYNLAHLARHRPRHAHVLRTRALRPFHAATWVAGSAGFGMSRKHGGVHPAPYQVADGVYVDPTLPSLGARPTVSEVALRAALKELGQPYVWGGAGPSTFDCSGLVMHSYARGGVRLVHYSGTQWNQGRLIPARDALPGDLILFGDPIFHVGIYLGAGWMLNAPFTGHYVDVVPVWQHVAGVVRP